MRKFRGYQFYRVAYTTDIDRGISSAPFKGIDCTEYGRVRYIRSRSCEGIINEEIFMLFLTGYNAVIFQIEVILIYPSARKIRYTKSYVDVELLSFRLGVGPCDTISYTSDQFSRPILSQSKVPQATSVFLLNSNPIHLPTRSSILWLKSSVFFFQSSTRRQDRYNSSFELFITTQILNDHKWSKCSEQMSSRGWGSLKKNLNACTGDLHACLIERSYKRLYQVPE